MAMRSMPARGRDVHHGSSNSGSNVYPPLPASPTLTNPDMILPDYDDDDDDDDHQIGPPQLHNQPTLTSWKHNPSTPLDFHLPQQSSFHNGPIQPSTPIIYGNGTMLSDIGEVTEVESTVGGPAAKRSSSVYSESEDDGTLLYSTKIAIRGPNGMKPQMKARQRRSSIESTSTVTTIQEHRRPSFGELDDSVSVDDSNFQGDDEESVAESYLDSHHAGAVNRHSGVSRTDEQFATNSISKRAEHILANAKRRLTTMEGNLSRARSSLTSSPMSDGSTPSPPMVRPATALRESTTPLSPSHSRNTSENSLHGFQRSSLQRSASALGAAGGYRQPLPSSKSMGSLDPGHPRSLYKMSNHPLDTALMPLNEDEDDLSQMDDRRYSALRSELVSPSPSMISLNDGGMPRATSAAQVRDLQEQMNGLKGKISTLKEQARADSLKRRSLQSLRTPSPFTHARWEHGFRDPHDAKSPDMSAQAPADEEVQEHVPAEAVDTSKQLIPEDQISVIEYERSATPKTSDSSQPNKTQSSGDKQQSESTGSELEAQKEETSDQSQEEAVVEAHTANAERNAGNDVLAGPVNEQDPERQYEEGEEEEEEVEKEGGEDEEDTGVEAEEEVEEGETYEDAQDNVSDSGESLYHDSYQHAISHEDREDAFDYEHFFLHSAMGSLSRQRYGRRGSSGSETSEDSVETTRGPASSDTRRRSIDTLSSVNSFTTATEGRASRSSTMERAPSTEATPTEDMEGALSPKRMTFGGFDYFNQGIPSHQEQPQGRHSHIVHRQLNSESGNMPGPSPRPSISSFESTGTNRSFPLVNKAKLNGNSVRSPGGDSPNEQLKQVTESLIADTAQASSQFGSDMRRGSISAMSALATEDKASVERLVASLGKCVVGLSQASRSGRTDGEEVFRQRIEAARRLLEGLQ